MASAPCVTPEAIQALLAEQMAVVVDAPLAERLAAYLDLLVRWNAKTNLSAIREPEAMVLRHFGESLQCADALPAAVGTLLDYGSGGGFPGVLCALRRPGLAVTLAESQAKKAAFLREACRTLELGLTSAVHGDRVEAMPALRRFDVVTLRAVDGMGAACVAARERAKPGGWLAVMTTPEGLRALAEGMAGVAWRPAVQLRGTERGIVALGRVLAG